MLSRGALRKPKPPIEKGKLATSQGTSHPIVLELAGAVVVFVVVDIKLVMVLLVTELVVGTCGGRARRRRSRVVHNSNSHA